MRVGWMCAALGLCCSAALGQTFENTNVQRYQRQLEQIQQQTTLLANPAVPIGQRALLDYGAYTTISYLSLDDNNRDNHGLRQYDLIGYARLNIDDVQELYARGRLSWLDFNPGDSFDGNGDKFEGRLERAYYRFDLSKAKAAYNGQNVNYDAALQGGRQLVYWGNGLSLVQTLDAVVGVVKYKTVDLQMLAGVTPADTIDVDSSRPGFDNNTHRGFYGAMLSKEIGEHRPYLYFLSQQDYNHSDSKVVGPTITHYNYNSYYLGLGSNGTIGDRLSYGLELVYEGGHGLSNGFTTDGGSFSQAVQTEEQIQAFAGDFRLDYVLDDIHKTRFSAESFFATGDDDRLNSTNTFGGNKSGTKDTGFVGFGQLNNGLAFAPSISNIMAVRFGASTFPLQQSTWTSQMQTGVDLFFFGKVNDAGGIDEPSKNKGYLGFEPDIFVNWQVRSDVTLALRYGLFFPGPGLVDHATRQFLYGGVTFAF